MAEDQGNAGNQGKKEDQFGFTPEGESLGYISLEQARVVAMRTARDHPGDYGRGFSGVRMVFDVAQQEEGEDYYIVTLSVRPEGDFDGQPGQEQFFIEKEGNVAHRQVRSLPRKVKGGFPKGRVAIGVVIVAIAVLAFLISQKPDEDSSNGSQILATPTPTTQAAPTSTATRVPATTAPLPPTRVPATTAPLPPTRVPATSAPAAQLPPTLEPTPTRPPTAGQVNDDHGDFMETASFLVNGRNPGVIGYANDYDYFQFSASAGEVYSIEVELETHPDSIITLFDENGAFLDENDDFKGLGRGSGIVFEAPYDGDYFVEVRSLNQDSDTGSYSLYFNNLGNAEYDGDQSDYDDHGDFLETASFVVDGRIPGVINHPQDFDYFQFSAGAGEVFSIEVALDSHPDTIITLFDENGDFLDENDDFEGLGRGSGIVYEAPFDGEYFVEVRSLNQGSDTGSYNLYLTYLGSATPGDDHGSTIETATGIGPGSIFGDLEIASDLDYFRIFADPNTTYVAEVKLDSHRNTALALMDRNGTLIQENDDAEGLNGGSRITWRTPPIETEYNLVVASMDPGVGTGTYILFVEPIADQHGDSRSLATPIVFETKFFGDIDPPDDLDYFRFSAKAGESYFIEAILDGHPDTMLTLYHFRGLRVDANDDGEGMDGGSRIKWTASAGGDYFIEVKSFDQDNQTGGYALYVERAAGPSIGGFYSGTITSSEGGVTGDLELDFSESQGEVGGYLTLYDPHVGSGNLEFASYSEGILEFSVFASFEGLAYVCDYTGDLYPDQGRISGAYDCFHSEGTVWYESGEWSAYR